MRKFFCGFLVGVIIGFVAIYVRVVKVKTTAYCTCVKCCGKYADGVTSIGRDAEKTMGVAIDPKFFNYGDWFYIPKVGLRVADDTGSMKSRHIDIRMSSHQEALVYGVKKIYVVVLRRLT